MAVLRQPQSALCQARGPQVDASAHISVGTHRSTTLRRRWLVPPFCASRLLVNALVPFEKMSISAPPCTTTLHISRTRPPEQQQLQQLADSRVARSCCTAQDCASPHKGVLSRAVAREVSDERQVGTDLSFLEPDDFDDPTEAERLQPKKVVPEILPARDDVVPPNDSRIVRIPTSIPRAAVPIANKRIARVSAQPGPTLRWHHSQ